MKRKIKPGISRRKFIQMTSTGAAAVAFAPIAIGANAGKAFTIIPSSTVSGLGHLVPSDKLYIAAVGCSGEGGNDIHHYATAPKKNAEVSFLCDVDDRMAAKRIKEFPKAKFYHDWREMFEKESKNFDAVSVAIPDHNHAIVGLSAMQMKKH